MTRPLALILVAIGLLLVLAAGWGYLPLRDFALNGTPTFSPKDHTILGPLSYGLEEILANDTPALHMDASVYCIALERRLYLLAFIGFGMIIGATVAHRWAIDSSRTDDVS